jgi:hypothetical protein
MSVTAIFVTEGKTEILPVIESLPPEWEIIVWDNGAKMVTRSDGWAEVCEDLSNYGRFRALDYASHELIYVQDDNVIVEDPLLIVKTMNNLRMENSEGPMIDAVVCNKDGGHEFLYGAAGAAFPRHLPGRTFEWYKGATGREFDDFFHRNCDLIFTGLTQRVIVESPYRLLSDQPSRDPGVAQVLELIAEITKQDWSRE